MVTPCYYPVKGGTETVVRNLSIELNKNDVYTDVMTFNMDKKWIPKWQGKNEKIDGINVYRVPALKWLPIGHSPKLTQGINLFPGRFQNVMKKYDLIHFHEVDLSFPFFSFFIKKPKILQLHGMDTNYFRRFRLSKIILKNIADYYISISKHIKEDLTNLGFPEERNIYIPNGVNTKIFHPIKDEKKDNFLLFVGRIEYEKGLKTLLESLRYIKTPIDLAIVGPPGWSSIQYKKIINKIKIQNKKGIHNVNYLGALDQKDIIKLYQRASIFLLPSYREGLPMVILEALSCGTPVIATPVGGIPDVISHLENGMLVPVRDSIKLAEAIQYLLDNRDVRTRMSNVGRKKIINNFSLDSTVKKLIKFYKDIIK